MSENLHSPHGTTHLSEYDNMIKKLLKHYSWRYLRTKVQVMPKPCLDMKSTSKNLDVGSCSRRPSADSEIDFFLL